jgi:hypothetical protein
MQDIFLILSAVGVDYGVYSYDERLSQLRNTIESVKKYKPNSYICLYDVSSTPIKSSDQILLTQNVDKFIDLSNHVFVTSIVNQLTKDDSNLAARKTIGELIGTLEFFGWLRNQNLDFRRVYKISGRLVLNDNFLVNDYDSMHNHVATTKRWWYDRYAYIIQLWSFDFKMLDKIFEVFNEIWKYEMDILTNKYCVDIVETTMYRYFQRYNIPVQEINGYLGVEGNHGQDGAGVYI